MRGLEKNALKGIYIYQLTCPLIEQLGPLAESLKIVQNKQNRTLENIGE